LTTEPLTEPACVDRAIDLQKPSALQGEPIYVHRFSASEIDPQGKPYRLAVHAYRIRAVSASGAER
jgi:hypothetical protein